MRKNQISVDICVPKYVTLKLYQDCYKVVIALPITPAAACKVGKYLDHCHAEILPPSIAFNRKFYCVQFTRTYHYDTPFDKSCWMQAPRDLAQLMTQLRLAKMDVIEDEITAIGCFPFNAQ